MLQQVTELLASRAPSCGGYGSEFTFTEREDGVLVELEADWAPRHCTPSCLVTSVEGESVTFQFLHYGEPDGDERTRTADELCSWLGEQASGA